MWMRLTFLAWPQGLKARPLAMVMARLSLALKVVPQTEMPKLRWPPKVPDRVANLDQGVDVDPMLNPKLLPSRRASAKGITLGRSSPGTQGVQVTEGKGIGKTKTCSMIAPAGRCKKVASQESRHRAQGPHATGPRVEEE